MQSGAGIYQRIIQGPKVPIKLDLIKGGKVNLEYLLMYQLRIPIKGADKITEQLRIYLCGINIAGSYRKDLYNLYNVRGEEIRHCQMQNSLRFSPIPYSFFNKKPIVTMITLIIINYSCDE